MPTIIATIRSVRVIQEDDDRVHWQSGAAVDADGANGQNGNPFAYRYPTNDGLDDIKGSAGYPKRKWRDIFVDDGSGHPLTHGNSHAYLKSTYTRLGRSIPGLAGAAPFCACFLGKP